MARCVKAWSFYNLSGGTEATEATVPTVKVERTSGKNDDSLLETCFAICCCCCLTLMDSDGGVNGSPQPALNIQMDRA